MENHINHLNEIQKYWSYLALVNNQILGASRAGIPVWRSRLGGYWETATSKQGLNQSWLSGFLAPNVEPNSPNLSPPIFCGTVAILDWSTSSASVDHTKANSRSVANFDFYGNQQTRFKWASNGFQPADSWIGRQHGCIDHLSILLSTSIL